MKNKKHFRESIHHFFIGFILIVEGFDKLHQQTIIGGLMLLFGITLLLYFVYVLIRKKQDFNLKIMAHLFEALTLLFTSYIYYNEGKIYLPYFNLAPSIALFISVVVMLYKRKKSIQTNKKKIDGRKGTYRQR
jgi:hypothetical protein